MLKSIVMMDLPIDEIAPIESWYEYTRLKSLGRHPWTKTTSPAKR
jgi:hypothetical protein